MAAPVPPGASRPAGTNQQPPPPNYNPNFQRSPDSVADNFQNLNLNRPPSMPNSAPRGPPFGQSPPFPSSAPSPGPPGAFSRPGLPPGAQSRPAGPPSGPQQGAFPPNAAPGRPMGPPPVNQPMPFGLFMPIMTIVTGVDLKVASTFSAFMVTGGSLANVVYYLFVKSPSRSCFIDYDIALLSEPCMLLGVSVGVICNLVFPEWLVTMLFAIFLAWSSFKTCTNGVKCWKCESEGVRRRDHEVVGKLENGLVGDCYGSEEYVNNIKEPLLGSGENCSKLGLPWLKLGALVMVWLSFFFVYLLRGSHHGQIVDIEPCGAGYWILSSLQIPLAIIFTAWILCKKESVQHQFPIQEGIEDLVRAEPPNKFIFPAMALFAGMLGGVFGIGGGMLISPLLIQVGIAPEVTAATCSFMVFFSSTMSAMQYLLLGMEHTETALVFALICFVASLIGLVVIQRAIQEYGRASLIVFSVSTVMVLSTVLMTSFGTYNVWRDYVSGREMGFKTPC